MTAHEVAVWVAVAGPPSVVAAALLSPVWDLVAGWFVDAPDLQEDPR